MYFIINMLLIHENIRILISTAIILVIYKKMTILIFYIT